MSEFVSTRFDDSLMGGPGGDWLFSGGGDDVLLGGEGNDTINAGTGSDYVDGGAGDDILVYVLGRNVGDRDVYLGGDGFDVLRLKFSAEEWASALVQEQLALYVDWRDALPSEVPAGELEYTLDFGGGTLLTVAGLEGLRVLVDDELIDPMAPWFTGGSAVAGIVDDGPLQTLQAEGALGFRALEWGQTHTVLVEAVDAPLGGSLQAEVADDVTGDGQGRVDWRYALDSTQAQPLAAGQTVDEVFRLTLADADGRFRQQEVTVSVTGVNDAPTIVDGDLTGRVVEDGGSDADPSTHPVASGRLQAHDPDAGDGLVWQLAAHPGPGLGSFEVDPASGQWTYFLDNAAAQQLADGQTVFEDFTVEVADAHGGRAAEVVRIAIVGAGDPVVVHDSLIATNAGMPVAGQLGASHADVGPPLMFSLGHAPQYGTVEIEMDGRYVYTPAEGYVGTDAFSFVVPDEQEGTVWGRTQIEVALADAPKVLVGGAGPDSFTGGSLPDALAGRTGDDRLDGLEGADLLSGGDGADLFVFSTAPGAGNVDTVMDFVAGVDRILLVNTAGLFGDLPEGPLNAAALHVAGDDAVPTAATRIVFDPATGTLAFDPDGSGATPAAPFALLDNLPPALQPGDFLIGA